MICKLFNFGLVYDGVCFLGAEENVLMMEPRVGAYKDLKVGWRIATPLRRFNSIKNSCTF